MSKTRIAVSGDLEEILITELVAAGAPIDLWGVGTDLGTSRDSPVVNGVYKLVADKRSDGWRGVWKLSPDKETVPGPKQVFRRYDGNVMSADVIAQADETIEGEALLVPAMRNGEVVHRESLEEIRRRSAAQLEAVPERLRRPGGEDRVEPHSVSYSERLRAAVDRR
jgi:nicotinate phosphoribosyltransferase